MPETRFETLVPAGFWSRYGRALREALAPGGGRGAAWRARLEALLADPDPAARRLEAVSARLGLAPFDRHCALLATAAAVDATLRLAIATFRNNLLWEAGDVDLAALLWAGDDVDGRAAALARFSAAAPLVRHGLVRLSVPHDATSRGLACRVVEASDALAGFLLGHEAAPAHLARCCEVARPARSPAELVAPPEVAARLDARLRAWREGGDGARPPFLLVRGPSGCGKSLLAEAAAHAAGLAWVRVDLPAVLAAPRPAEALEEAFALAAVRGALLSLEHAAGPLAPGSALVPAVAAGVGRAVAPVVIEALPDGLLDARVDGLADEEVRLEAPGPAEREALWRLAAAGARLADDVDLAALASEFELTGGGVVRALGAATAARDAAGQDDLRAAALLELRADAGPWTVRRSTHRSLDDIVLPADSRAELEAVVRAWRHRAGVMAHWGFGRTLDTGRGLCVLFVGESGTGKTFAASLVAEALGRPLMQLSLAQVTSKWVGETEKRLDDAFRAARASQSILLFDEADALFTKRVSVESANDRYSNMEVDYLLQAIDRFEGMVVLTTNLDSSMDTAFRRRIQFVVRFPKPGPAERAAIWRRTLPPEVPVAGDVDFEALGEDYDLSGGQIRNAVLRAAYDGYGRGAGLAEAQLRRAATAECAAAGKVVREYREE